MNKINILESKNEALSETIYKYESKNKNLINIIENQKIKIFYQIQMVNTLKQNVIQLQNEKEKISNRDNFEKMNLIKDNKEYKKFILMSNEEIKKLKNSYMIKLNEFNNKIKEKDNKIKSLKKRVNELYYKNISNNSNVNIDNSSNKYENNCIPTEYNNYNDNFFNAGFQSSSQFYPRNNINGIDNTNLINNNFKICHLKDNNRYKKK